MEFIKNGSLIISVKYSAPYEVKIKSLAQFGIHGSPESLNI